jgi:hypothetical protein
MDFHTFESRIDSEIQYVILKLLNEHLRKGSKNPKEFKHFKTVGEIASFKNTEGSGLTKGNKEKRFSILAPNADET